MYRLLWFKIWRSSLCTYIHTYIRTVGAENMFPFRSELRWKTLFEVRRYFVRSSGLLRTKSGATSYEVRGYFVRSSGLLRSKFGATSFEVRGYFVRSSGLLRSKFGAISFEVRRYFKRNSPLCTNFSPTSNELRLNFERTSAQLRTNFAWKHNFRGYRTYVRTYIQLVIYI